MKYQGLREDFGNIRETQAYAVCKVVDEAEKYIEYLEGKEALLEGIISYLNQLDESKNTETKQEILDGFAKILPAG